MRHIRKSVADLSLADLEQFPAWEFALDEEGEEGQDESTVKPHQLDRELDPADGMFAICAEFHFADGTSARGYLYPPAAGESDLGSIQPVVVTPSGQVQFWCGIIAPSPEQKAAWYALLGGRKPQQVFPATFRSLVPLATGPVSGSIPGFVVLTDMASGHTRVEW